MWPSVDRVNNISKSVGEERIGSTNGSRPPTASITDVREDARLQMIGERLPIPSNIPWLRQGSLTHNELANQEQQLDDINNNSNINTGQNLMMHPETNTTIRFAHLTPLPLHNRQEPFHVSPEKEKVEKATETPEEEEVQSKSDKIFYELHNSNNSNNSNTKINNKPSKTKLVKTIHVPSAELSSSSSSSETSLLLLSSTLSSQSEETNTDTSAEEQMSSPSTNSKRKIKPHYAQNVEKNDGPLGFTHTPYTSMLLRSRHEASDMHEENLKEREEEQQWPELSKEKNHNKSRIKNTEQVYTDNYRHKNDNDNDDDVFITDVKINKESPNNEHDLTIGNSIEMEERALFEFIQPFRSHSPNRYKGDNNNNNNSDDDDNDNSDSDQRLLSVEVTQSISSNDEYHDDPYQHTGNNNNTHSKTLKNNNDNNNEEEELRELLEQIEIRRANQRESVKRYLKDGAPSLFSIPIPQFNHHKDEEADGNEANTILSTSHVEINNKNNNNSATSLQILPCGESVYDVYEQVASMEHGHFHTKLNGLDVTRFMFSCVPANELIVCFFWYVVLHARRAWMERVLIGRYYNLVVAYRELLHANNICNSHSYSSSTKHNSNQNVNRLPSIAHVENLIVEIMLCTLQWKEHQRCNNSNETSFTPSKKRHTIAGNSPLHYKFLNLQSMSSLPSLMSQTRLESHNSLYQFITRESFPTLYKVRHLVLTSGGNDLPEDRVVEELCRALDYFTDGCNEYRQLVTQSELIYRRVALLFGEIFNSFTSDRNTVKDVVLESYSLIVPRVVYFALLRSFPNDTHAGLFNVDFRADLHRLFHFWTSGLILSHVAVRQWPEPQHLASRPMKLVWKLDKDDHRYLLNENINSTELTNMHEISNNNNNNVKSSVQEKSNSFRLGVHEPMNTNQSLETQESGLKQEHQHSQQEQHYKSHHNSNNENWNQSQVLSPTELVEPHRLWWGNESRRSLVVRRYSEISNNSINSHSECINSEWRAKRENACSERSAVSPISNSNNINNKKYNNKNEMENEASALTKSVERRRSVVIIKEQPQQQEQEEEQCKSQEKENLHEQHNLNSNINGTCNPYEDNDKKTIINDYLANMSTYTVNHVNSTCNHIKDNPLQPLCDDTYANVDVGVMNGEYHLIAEFNRYVKHADFLAEQLEIRTKEQHQSTTEKLKELAHCHSPRNEGEHEHGKEEWMARGPRRRQRSIIAMCACDGNAINQYDDDKSSVITSNDKCNKKTKANVGNKNINGTKNQKAFSTILPPLSPYPSKNVKYHSTITSTFSLQSQQQKKVESKLQTCPHYHKNGNYDDHGDQEDHNNDNDDYNFVVSECNNSIQHAITNIKEWKARQPQHYEEHQQTEKKWNALTPLVHRSAPVLSNYAFPSHSKSNSIIGAIAEGNKNDIYSYNNKERKLDNVKKAIYIHHNVHPSVDNTNSTSSEDTVKAHNTKEKQFAQREMLKLVNMFSSIDKKRTKCQKSQVAALPPVRVNLEQLYTELEHQKSSTLYKNKSNTVNNINLQGNNKSEHTLHKTSDDAKGNTTTVSRETHSESKRSELSDAPGAKQFVFGTNSSSVLSSFPFALCESEARAYLLYEIGLRYPRIPLPFEIATAFVQTYEIIARHIKLFQSRHFGTSQTEFGSFYGLHSITSKSSNNNNNINSYFDRSFDHSSFNTNNSIYSNHYSVNNNNFHGDYDDDNINMHNSTEEEKKIAECNDSNNGNDDVNENDNDKDSDVDSMMSCSISQYAHIHATVEKACRRSKSLKNLDKGLEFNATPLTPLNTLASIVMNNTNSITRNANMTNTMKTVEDTLNNTEHHQHSFVSLLPRPSLMSSSLNSKEIITFNAQRNAFNSPNQHHHHHQDKEVNEHNGIRDDKMANTNTVGRSMVSIIVPTGKSVQNNRINNKKSHHDEVRSAHYSSTEPWSDEYEQQEQIHMMRTRKFYKLAELISFAVNEVLKRPSLLSKTLLPCGSPLMEYCNRHNRCKHQRQMMRANQQHENNNNRVEEDIHNNKERSSKWRVPQITNRSVRPSLDLSLSEQDTNARKNKDLFHAITTSSLWDSLVRLDEMSVKNKLTQKHKRNNNNKNNRKEQNEKKLITNHNSHNNTSTPLTTNENNKNNNAQNKLYRNKEQSNTIVHTNTNTTQDSFTYWGAGKVKMSNTRILVVRKDEGVARPRLLQPLAKFAHQQENAIRTEVRSIATREAISRRFYNNVSLQCTTQLHEAMLSEAKCKEFRKDAVHKLKVIELVQKVKDDEAATAKKAEAKEADKADKASTAINKTSIKTNFKQMKNSKLNSINNNATQIEINDNNDVENSDVV